MGVTGCADADLGGNEKAHEGCAEGTQPCGRAETRIYGGSSRTALVVCDTEESPVTRRQNDALKPGAKPNLQTMKSDPFSRGGANQVLDWRHSFFLLLILKRKRAETH